MGKVIVKDAVKPEEFKPFTFEVTVETPEEYRELWHRFNISITDLRESIKDSSKIDNLDFSQLTQDVFDALDEIHTGDYTERFIYK